MIEKKISFWLTTIDVCGYQVPTKQSCEAIGELLKENTTNWLIFCGYNNYLASIHETHFNPNDYLSTCDPSERYGLNLKSRLVEIDRNITDYSGCFDFTKLRVARAIFDWHRTIRGNYTGTDTQQLLKALGQVQNGKYNFYDIKFPSKKDYSHLLESAGSMSDSERRLNNEFIYAYDYIKRFDKYVDCLSPTDEYIRNLSLEKVYIIRKILNLPKIYDPPKFLFTCPFCSKSEIIDQRKKPKSCGSPECEKAYSANTTRKNINQPYAVNNKSKNNSRWVKMDNIYRWCIDSCGKRRLVDYQFVCKKCHDKTV
jgi:hypothetical protein